MMHFKPNAYNRREEKKPKSPTSTDNQPLYKVEYYPDWITLLLRVLNIEPNKEELIYWIGVTFKTRLDEDQFFDVLEKELGRKIEKIELGVWTHYNIKLKTPLTKLELDEALKTVAKEMKK